MEHNRIIFNSPTGDELKVLKHFLPQIKAKAENAASHEVKAARSVLTQKFCSLCGESLINKQKRSPNTNKLCKECDSMLASGHTALVTMDGKYAFGKFADNDETKHLIGKILPVQLEVLETLCKAQNIKIQDVQQN
jgi:hypothetical protein